MYSPVQSLHLLILDSSRSKLLLLKTSPKTLQQQISSQWKNPRCMKIQSDSCEYFTAARIILRDIYGIGINYFYDDLTLETRLFTNILAILNEQTIDYHNYNQQIVLVLEWSDVLQTETEIINHRNQIDWFHIDEILQNPTISQYTVKLLRQYSHTFQLSKSYLDQYFIFDLESELLFTNFYGALYQSKYRKPAQNWKVFKIFQNQFPSIQQLQNCKAVIISGSKSNVDQKQPHLEQLCQLIRTIFRSPNMPKMVGICFGHQIIAHSLGANVGPIQNLQQKANYFQFFDLMNLKLQSSFLQSSFVNDSCLDLQDGLNICKAHGYEVKSIPAFMTSYATSLTTKYEIIGVPGKVLSFQGHPEFDVSLIETKLLPEKVVLRNACQQRTNQIISNYIQLGLDNNKTNQLIRQFINT